MKIPNKVKVSGQIYTVLKNYKFHQNVDLVGQACHNTLEIRLSGLDTAGGKLKESKKEEIFIHELLHCVDNIYNNNSLEEKTISRLAYGLHQVLVDNDIS